MAVIAFCAVFAALAGSAAGAVEPAQIGMPVRFHELPGGYTIGDEGVGCGIIDPEGTEPPLSEFLARRLPRVCEATYERRFVVAGKDPDPPRVDSAVVDLRTAAAARAAAKLLPELVARLTGNGVSREAKTTVTIGAGTRLSTAARWSKATVARPHSLPGGRAACSGSPWWPANRRRRTTAKQPAWRGSSAPT